MNKTQLISDLGDRTDMPRRDIVAFLDALEASVVAGLKKDGVAVVGNVVRITKKEVPARPAGEYPGFGGELRYSEAKPASTKLRAALPKAMKDQVQ